MDYNFIRVATATPIVKPCDCNFNTKNIIEITKNAIENSVELLVFPELCITGYTCMDLFFQEELLKSALNNLKFILDYSKNKNIIITVGVPIKVNSHIYNTAVVICNGHILGVVPKIYLPNKEEFYEKRWFESGENVFNKTIKLFDKDVLFSRDVVFSHTKNQLFKFGVEVCEDLWAVVPPSLNLCLNGANIILNLSASTETAQKGELRKSIISNHSYKTNCAYIYSNIGYGESTTDVVFSGQSFIYENGNLQKESKTFSLDNEFIFCDIDLDLLNSQRMKSNSFVNESEVIDIGFDLEINNKKLYRFINPYPFTINDSCFEDAFKIATFGLVKRLEASKAKKAIIGVSGGLDSTLAILIVNNAFEVLNMDKKNIVGITMQGFGTTKTTLTNSIKLMDLLNIDKREISIVDACLQHFKDIGHNKDILDTTYENVQARERTQILMDIANKENGIVVGTGDLSEITLGWSTYNGDHMSMYSVNGGIPKTFIKPLINYIVDNYFKNNKIKDVKQVIDSIINTPISPELLPTDKDGNIKQKTEEIIGPYELHDFFIYNLMEHNYTPKKMLYVTAHAFANKYTEEEIKKWLKIFYKRFFTMQFKRSCMPDGPKIFAFSLSPRGDLKMPSDASFNIFLEELD